MSNKCFIKIKKADKSYVLSLRKGLRLDVLNTKKDSVLEFDCLKASCGICIFKILDGRANLSETTPEEEQFLKSMRADKDERLACQCRVFGDISLEIEYY